MRRCRSVRPGQTFKYRVTLRSQTAGAPLDLDGLVLRVLLPEGTRYSKGKAVPKPAPWRSKYLAPALVNHTVVVPLSPLSGRIKRALVMQLRTNRSMPASSITVVANIYQPSGAGLSICPRYANNVTLAVIA